MRKATKGSDIPDAFGKYRVDTTKAPKDGSYGRTFFIKSDGKPLVVKWLHNQHVRDAVDRFEDEAWALKTLDHPSIPHLISQGDKEGRPYIVMTLASGCSLRELSQRQLADRGLFGQRQTLRITERVLSALEHMNSRDVVHRDVKDSNVMFDEASEQVTLIDLGFCKGRGRPKDPHTFSEVGAARYAPPAKLKNPTRVDPTHDVFALGVLGYLLLTNSYPWEGQDRGDLVERMASINPAPIHRLNPNVSMEVSQFFSWLMQIDDRQRPDATRAHKRSEELINGKSGGSAPLTSTPRGRPTKYPNEIRDPVHGDIVMTDFEWKLMKTAEMERLQWLRQLGTSHLVYPGAEHTRLSHAIGTMHVASEIMRRIEQRTGERFEPEEWLEARVYALIHDVTQIPYGHALEDELGIFNRHDKNGDRVSRVLFGDSEFAKLIDSEPYGRQSLSHFARESKPREESWLTELVESSCGADVIDYVDRDAYYCGLDHKVDSAIYRWFLVEKPGAGSSSPSHLIPQLSGHHGFRLDADFALESILRERYALYLKVYAHPVKVAAGAMIGKAVWVAKNESTDPLTEHAIERMGDNDLLHFLRDRKVPVSSTLAEGILHRRLWRWAFRAEALQSLTYDEKHYEAQQLHFRNRGFLHPEGRENIEKQIAQQAKVNADELIFYCPPNAPGLRRLEQHVLLPTGKEVHGDAYESHLRIRSAHMRLWTVFVFVSPEMKDSERDAVCRASETVLKLKNDKGLDQKQLALLFL